MGKSKSAPRPKALTKEEVRAKKKGCMYCKYKVDQIDYKQYTNLRAVISEKGKLKSRRVTGLCRRHQNQIATSVKRAREVALLPYVGA